MTPAHIRQHRLANQHISSTSCTKPEEIVQTLVAMQAQEYASGKWAIGLRLPGSTEGMMDQAFNDGRILRTHLLRPTWHFVTPADIGWLLTLTAPRVHAINAFMYRKTGLDDATFRKSHKVMQKALEGNNYLTRAEIKAELERSKIATGDTVRLSCIMMHAELEGLICSGPRKGKQFTYALIAERAPGSVSLMKDEALHELTNRYFQTRGPATVHDYATWSGLSIADAKKGINELPSSFLRFTTSGQEYILHQDAKPAKGQQTFLMPNYDEYGMSYKDRTAFIPLAADRTPEFNIHQELFIVNGVAIGSWVATKGGVDFNVPHNLSKTLLKGVEAAVDKFQKFYKNT